MKSKLLLFVLLISCFVFVAAPKADRAEASGTIYIKADGSIVGTDKITSAYNITYTLTDNINDFIVLERDDIIVDGAGYTVQGTLSGNGIDLSYRYNVTLKNVRVTNFGRGIYLYYSISNVLAGNNVSNNDVGILLSHSSNNNLTGNNALNNNNGIFLSSSSNDVITGNNASNNTFDGFLLNSSNNSTIVGNTASNNTLNYGFNLDSCTNTTLARNNASNNIAGIHLIHSNNSTLTDNNVSSNSDWGIWLEHSSNSIVNGNIALNNGYEGILISSSSNCTLTGNTASSNNATGINIYSDSNCNTLTGNTALNNGKDGITLEYSSNNTLAGNTVSSNNVTGIRLAYSGNNNLTSNTASDNWRNFGVYGDSFSYFDNYVDMSNTVDGKPIYYLIGAADAVHDAGTSIGTIYLINSSNITIRDLTLKGNSYGVFLFNTTRSKIENVTTSNNECGIGLSSSSNNTLTGNTASNNDYGFWFHSSSSNCLFHNLLINNAYTVYVTYWTVYANTWDNGYPYGGNYWSNYAGIDVHSGPHQNETGSDGIGDATYIINPSNIDHYPLMGMFSSFNTSLGHSVDIVSNSTIEDFAYFESNSTITLDVSNTSVNQIYGFCRLTIPHELLSPPYTITINDAQISYTPILENETLSIIYFSYEHSNLEIVIIPEFPSLLILPLFFIATLLAVIAHKRRTRR